VFYILLHIPYPTEESKLIIGPTTGTNPDPIITVPASMSIVKLLLHFVIEAPFIVLV
jgi:hypothetical protein